ncbi:unnamed protein product [Miscanthus lutarioriparius]|uniref:Helicase ATP-binding domain-containing protein n=1 Tax=Miscanthus lutarioriparius TaxID=422564 RepID=A0A811Q631_9POAL|nr:unnamed protein product [Miscanthus lutarioriparius]
MGLTEGLQLVSSRTNEGHMSSQVVESKGPEKKAMPEQSVKKRRRLIEKDKFYHHCVLITSNLSNLDQGILKSDLQTFWKLSGDWEPRRECSKSFLASFSSEDDVISCLKHPKMETLLDDKEVNLTVTRWEEGDEESLDLIEEWVLVCGVRRIYRNWKDLYQVASAFGVLIDVDEKSLEAGDKEPIRLKIALRSLDGAPFSYYFALGRSSRLVMVTVVQDKAEGMQQQNKESDKEHNKELNASQSIFLEEPECIEESRLAGEIKGNKISAPAATTANTKKTTMDSSKPEEVQPVGRSSTTMIGEEHFEGKPKPPIKHVFKRRVSVIWVFMKTYSREYINTALIIVPTRDLMYETEKVIEVLGQFHGVKAYTSTGGTSFRVNQQTLSSRVQVVIGTPGCILDLLARDALCKDHIRMLVLDEAYELLTGGFKDQTCNIIHHLPAKIQIGLFSAAFSSEALETSHWFMDKHVTIKVPRDEELKDIGIKQFYHKVEKEEKLGKLYALFETLEFTRIVIFVNTKQGVKSLIQDVRAKGYAVSASHGVYQPCSAAKEIF